MLPRFPGTLIVGFVLKVYLPQSPKGWAYECVPLCLVSICSSSECSIVPIAKDLGFSWP